MALHHAVLALLADGPSHGYALRSSFEQAVGPEWGGLNIGHLYQLLDRLARDGLIVAERQAQPSKPDRLVYQLTEQGAAELSRWLDTPAERTRGYRDDFFLKLLAARSLADPGVLAGVLGRQREYLLRTLRGIGQSRARAERDPVADLLTTAAELHTRADLALLDAAEQQLLGTNTPLPTRPRVPAAKPAEHVGRESSLQSPPASGHSSASL